MTDQELFDKVVAHAKKQKKRALQYSYGCFQEVCVYRVQGSDLKCFIGIFIPDDKYNRTLEKYDLLQLISINIIEKDINTDLLYDLQEVHDCFDTKDWHDNFMIGAKVYNLKYNGKREDYISGEESGPPSYIT